MPDPCLSVRAERWPIAGAFTISRGSKTEAEVVVAEISAGAICGRGECTPYARYGETVADVAEAIRAMATELARGLDRTGLQSAMPPGAARNALDCAFWDLEAKCAGRPVHELLSQAPSRPMLQAEAVNIDPDGQPIQYSITRFAGDRVQMLIEPEGA